MIKIEHVLIAILIIGICLSVASIWASEWIGGIVTWQNYLDAPSAILAQGGEALEPYKLQAEAAAKRSERSREFWNSFYSSAWQDLAFFGTIGIVALLFGIQNPKQQPLETRIRNLFSADGTHQAAQPYVQAQVKRLAVYERDARADLTFTEKSNDAYRMEVDMQATLENMFADQDLQDVPYWVHAGGDSEWQNSGAWGGIRGIELRQDGKQIDRPIRHEQFGPEGIRKPILVNVPRNGGTELFQRYWLCHDVSADYMVNVQTFRSSFTVSVKNRLESEIRIHVFARKEDGSEYGEVILKPEQYEEFIVGETTPQKLRFMRIIS